MLTIHVWPKRLKEFLLTHPLYKSPRAKNKKAIRKNHFSKHQRRYAMPQQPCDDNQAKDAKHNPEDRRVAANLPFRA